ncbi:MAG: alpha/beta hydrolase [Gammaproteobacteria bacterium]|nr:alpha/beta hydrolase [Gammaproteobacteria bacterium]MBU2409387.1 alpha/beta hydrolase [Gammaproteobacteria bacterium]
MSRRRLIGLSAAGLVSSLLPYRLAAANGSGITSSEAMLRYVDPELRGPFLLEPATVDAETLPQIRAGMETGRPAQLARPGIARRLIPGPKGAPDVSVLIVNAQASTTELRPAVLYLHGGGYVAGDAIGEIALAQQIALDHDCVVISVDYRLAPETRFPGALEDNYAALKWLYTNADALGVDRDRIATMGTSAGGGHAAMLSAAATDRGEVPILFQLLLSPMLDDRTGSTRNGPAHIGAFIWAAEANAFGWTSLLGVPAGSPVVPAGAVPSRREYLRGLPPTYIGVGSIDLFVGENIDYATRLVAAGVPVELNVVPGAYHVFFAIKPDADISRRFRQSYNQALARAFRMSAPSA